MPGPDGLLDESYQTFRVTPDILDWPNLSDDAQYQSNNRFKKKNSILYQYWFKNSLNTSAANFTACLKGFYTTTMRLILRWQGG